MRVPALRPFANGLVLVASLIVVLPLIAVAERLRAGAGGALATTAIRVISGWCGLRYEVHGLERLDPASRYVLVPNHSSPADIPALLYALPGVRFVAAAELFRIPLLGAAMRALHAVPVDRSRPRSTLDIAEGEASIVVFAEGGIPEPGEHRRFRTGAFVLAIETATPIVPVTITGSATVLPRGQKIWVRPGRITVELHPPIETVGRTLRDRKALRDETEEAVRRGGITRSSPT